MFSVTKKKTRSLAKQRARVFWTVSQAFNSCPGNGSFISHIETIYKLKIYCQAKQSKVKSVKVNKKTAMMHQVDLYSYDF